ncbi:glycosyltransferase family 1 protein [Balneolaceae bacterium YR4-1]|uniref:Glycosyltransferase family 1 protein n=1 Tax=Halalkalibaculum roseum TaxID=2709311 RepID=A0A6M1T466_9BACT|nr:glycosyltransferase [Halalkalibaculum roseum]NGP76785.1 glycosyltransferase family 1 protein [Halalkalibaculum roseum]
MRSVFIQTYPIYHDLLDTEQWLGRINRDRWMPGILADMGSEVELWGGDYEGSVHKSDIDEEGMGSYKIRLFETVSDQSQTKKHYSDALVEYAKSYDADLHLLKGVDGGVGIRLLNQYLLPEDKPFVFIIGGKFYTGNVPKADLVFYETEEQKEKLNNPGWRFWRRAVEEERLLRLPKSVDTDLFSPAPDLNKKWDIVCVGRLINRYKTYDELEELSEHFKVCMVGGGPAKEEFEKKFPKIDFVGQVPNDEVPNYLNQAHAFIHPGENDYFPRVISEAAACGCILLAFADSIATDVLPTDCGLRLDRDSYVQEIKELFDDKVLMKQMGNNARNYAVECLHKFSTKKPMEKMLQKLDFHFH